MDLIHYVLVRRDLPFGQTLAMVGHAAADSMEKWARSWYRYHRKHLPITMVALGVADEKALMKARLRLIKEGILQAPIHELVDDHTQLMAVGIEPGERTVLEPFFKGYGTYKTFEGPPPPKPQFPENTKTVSEHVVKG